MGYRIDYGGKYRDRQTNIDSIFRRICLTICFLSLFMSLVCGFWPEGQTVLRSLLIPGDSQATLEAAEVFARDLQQGLSFGEGLGDFFRSVLHGAVSD